MDNEKALGQQRQHRQWLLLQQQSQQQQQQRLLFLQQLQNKHDYPHHRQQLQAASGSVASPFPSNVDAHLQPPGHFLRPFNPQNASPSLHPDPHLQQAQQQQQHLNLSQRLQQQQLQQQKGIRPGNHVELQMAYQDAWRVCHPDVKRPFSSLEDACERLLPYHVVADYEAEEEVRILDSNTAVQDLSRSQQWDQNIASKVMEFTATLEKQVLAFNKIVQKRAAGEFRAEERLMIEQALLQEEKRSLIEISAEIESRKRAEWEAQGRVTAIAQAEQAWVASQAHAQMMPRAN